VAEHMERMGHGVSAVARMARPVSAARPRSQMLRLGLSFALLGLLFYLVDLEAVGRTIAGARLELLALMFLCMVGERLFAAFRWLVLLRTVEPGVAYWPVLRVTLVSNFVGTFLPGGVGIEVLRVYGLSRAMADLPLALSSVLVERLCGLLALILLTLLGLLLAPIHLPGIVQIVVGPGFLVLVLAGGALLHPWSRRLARRALALPALAPLRARLAGFERRVDAYARRPFALALSLALALTFQILRVSTVVVGAYALGIDAALTIFIAIVPITILVALLPISLGGLGAREASYVALFGLAGVQPEAALVLALAREAMQLVTTLPGAVLYARSPAPLQAPGDLMSATKTHQAVSGGGSALNRYQDVMVGSRSLLRTLYCEFCAWLAPVPGALGLFLRQLFWPRLLGSCGRGAVFGTGVVLRHPHRIHLGDRVAIGEGCVLDARHDGTERALVLDDDVLLANYVVVSCKGAGISIGAHSGIGAHSVVIAIEGNDVRIGADVAIGAHGSIIGGGNYHDDRLDVPMWRQGTRPGHAVVLEDDLWIGGRVSILGGVRIGRGSIVGAGAVVTRDVEPLTVCAGVPARPLRRRGEAQHGRAERRRTTTD
jgi:uncharacterized protein (TIRG00374 family)